MTQGAFLPAWGENLKLFCTREEEEVENAKKKKKGK